MDSSQGKEAESSNSRNWDELFHLFSEAIASNNDTIKIKAIVNLAKMCRYAPENILGLTVPILLDLLGNSDTNPSPLVQEASAYCLKCIASHGEGAMANLIGQPGPISTLVRLLPNSEGGLRTALLKCLRNVVTFWAPNRTVLVSQGGLQIILFMLGNCSGESKLILLEILSALALMREVRMLVWNSRRVNLLVEAARCGSMVSRTRAAQAIGLLGLTKRARRMLVDAGVVPVLMHLLDHGCPATKLVAGNALGVISSHIDHIRPVAQAGAIPLYAELLQGPDVIGKEIAEDVFCVLAVYEDNAIPIIERLVGILIGDDIGARAAAADVIWDLSSYKYSFPLLQNSGVIPILVELLEDENIDVREKVAGAIAQLSQNGVDRMALAICGAIPRLISMVENESEEVRDNAAEALVNFSLDPFLGDQMANISENPAFQSMRDRVMQVRASEEYMNMSLRQISTEQLNWDPGFF